MKYSPTDHWPLTGSRTEQRIRCCPPRNSWYPAKWKIRHVWIIWRISYRVVNLKIKCLPNVVMTCQYVTRHTYIRNCFIGLSELFTGNFPPSTLPWLSAKRLTRPPITSRKHPTDPTAQTCEKNIKTFKILTHPTRQNSPNSNPNPRVHQTREQLVLPWTLKSAHD